MSDDTLHDELQEATGRAIRARRAELGMTLRDLADACGISYSYLSEIERGGSGKRVTTDKLMAVAHALGLTPSDLLERGEALWRSATPVAAEDAPPPRDLLQRGGRDEGPESDPSARRLPPRDPTAREQPWDYAAQRAAWPDEDHAPGDQPHRNTEREMRHRIGHPLEDLELEDLRVIETLAQDLRRRADEIRIRYGRRRRS